MPTAASAHGSRSSDSGRRSSETMPGVDPADVTLLSDGAAHRALLLFMRANVSKSGALCAAEMAEISWMPMLGGVATALSEKLAAAGGEQASLEPDGWLALCATHVGTEDAALRPWLSMCEAMSDTFPELEVRASTGRLP